jgi:hypothetical protein
MFLSTLIPEASNLSFLTNTISSMRPIHICGGGGAFKFGGTYESANPDP